MAPHDSALLDSALSDPAPPDAASPESAPPDAVSPDAVSPDSVSPESVSHDAALPDSPLPDAASPDPALRDGASSVREPGTEAESVTSSRLYHFVAPERPLAESDEGHATPSATLAHGRGATPSSASAHGRGATPPTSAHGRGAQPTAAVGPVRSRTMWGEAWYRLKRNPSFWFAAVLTVFILLVAAWPQLFRDRDPRRCILADSRAPMSAEFPLGADFQGCDILTTIIYGARASVSVGLLSAFSVTLLGTVLGVVA
ncbi:MAG: hypothetical protein LBS56_05190, partial [Propionibacteriaceae bacterium]|nr:hypothetical protein [Propionibacteriaceae bacterium]